MFSPTPEQVTDIQQRYADGYPIRAIVAHYGLDVTNNMDYDLVFNICHRRRRHRNLTEPPPWAPSCISGTEYAEWKALMQKMTRVEYRVARPCDDCDRHWAKTRREAGVCNGTLPEERAYAAEAR